MISSRLALPAGTMLLVGEGRLDHPVSWACSLRPNPPAFPNLAGNEVALIDMDDLRRLGDRMRLERVITDLRSARIAALVVRGSVDEAAVRSATVNDVPLFKLPDNAQMLQVERTIIRLIVDREGYLSQRSTELQHELNRIVLDGGSLDRIAAHLALFSQQPTLILQEDGQVVAEAGFELLSPQSRESLLESIPNGTALRSAGARAEANGAENSSTVGRLPLAGQSSMRAYAEVVVAPITANDSIHGFCLILRPSKHGGGPISAVERVAAGQGAAAAALEWAKQNAVGIAEERMRATFVDELLASEIADRQAWIQRGKSLGYDLAAPHAAWLIEAHGIVGWPTALLRYAESCNVSAPFSRRDSNYLLFWPLNNAKSARELKSVASDFAEQVLAGAPSATLVIGIGRPAATPDEWVRTLQQAGDSLHLGKTWRGSAVTYFGDLGLYQLLTTLGSNPEARRFFRRTLAKLIEHDTAHQSEFIHTLDGFFTCHGNLSQTAKQLHIHRNTLTYRLERIAEITQLDLSDADARFSLQLALKLRSLMRLGQDS